MAKPRENAGTLTPIIHTVFPECLRQFISRGDAPPGDTEIGRHSLAITLSSLFPLRRGVIGLVNAGGDCGAYDGIRPERIEKIIVQLDFLRRTDVSEL